MTKLVRCGETDLSLLGVGVTSIFLGDMAARGTPCLLETAQVPSKLPAPGIAKVALLYEQLVDDRDGTRCRVIQSSGLRFRPRWGVRPLDGSVIPLDLVDCFQDHISSFFALSHDADSSEDETEDVSDGYMMRSTAEVPGQRLLVRAEAVSLVLAAPPVKTPSSSGVLLHIDGVDIDLAKTQPGDDTATTAIVIRGMTVFLTDDHARGKGNGPPSEAELQRYKATYSEVARIPVVAVSVQPGSADNVRTLDIKCGQGHDCAGSSTNVGTGGAAGGAGAGEPSISLHTCGDSFHTLNHLIQELVEARTTELDIRKTPSSSGHSVSRAVFADGQTALIREAEETSAFEESSEAVQMDAVQWSSTPVIRDAYIDEQAGVYQLKLPLAFQKRVFVLLSLQTLAR